MAELVLLERGTAQQGGAVCVFRRFQVDAAAWPRLLASWPGRVSYRRRRISLGMPSEVGGPSINQAIVQAPRTQDSKSSIVKL